MSYTDCLQKCRLSHVCKWGQSIVKALTCEKAEVSPQEQLKKQRLYNPETVAEEKDKFEFK